MAHYLISEASRRLQVEAHVLRYWEEELKLDIPRNELGHRYYTEKQLALFQKIKELKELGYQLKAIRTSLNRNEEGELNADEAGFLLEKDRMIKEGEPRFTVLSGDGTGRNRGEPEESAEKISESAGDEEEGSQKPEEAGEAFEKEAKEISKAAEGMENGTETELLVHENGKSLMASPEKMEQFQTIMTDVLSEALRRNQTGFGNEVGGQISDRIVKEMNYLMRNREEREEERYRKLDETIRTCQRVQKQRNEAAATKVPERRSRKRKFGLGRKKKQ